MAWVLTNKDEDFTWILLGKAGAFKVSERCANSMMEIFETLGIMGHLLQPNNGDSTN